MVIKQKLLPSIKKFCVLHATRVNLGDFKKILVAQMSRVLRAPLERMSTKQARQIVCRVVGHDIPVAKELLTANHV
jgi:hypothetical protein